MLGNESCREPFGSCPTISSLTSPHSGEEKESLLLDNSLNTPPPEGVGSVGPRGAVFTRHLTSFQLHDVMNPSDRTCRAGLLS